jgi:hypothetical protein
MAVKLRRRPPQNQYFLHHDRYDARKDGRGPAETILP